jgi:hypothetical protein
MSEHKKVHFFCEEDGFSLDILFYRQRDAFPKEPLGSARGHDRLRKTMVILRLRLVHYLELHPIL